MKELDDFESKYQGAKSYIWKWFWRITLLCVALGFLFGGVGLISGFFSNGAKVVQKEFYPETLLKKYEWFKDAAAQLDKKRADIQIYEARLKEATIVDRTDREQRMLWVTELSGIKASYNGLAAEYNSQMAKLNWRFTNIGDLPPGGEPLPREFRTYSTN